MTLFRRLVGIVVVALLLTQFVLAQEAGSAPPSDAEALAQTADDAELLAQMAADAENEALMTLNLAHTEEYVREGYTPDGFEPAKTVRIRNDANGLYLKADSRNVVMAPLDPNDDGFLWIVYEPGTLHARGEGIFNAATGLALVSAGGTTATIPYIGDSSQQWLILSPDKAAEGDDRRNIAAASSNILHPGQSKVTIRSLVPGGRGATLAIANSGRHGKTNFDDPRFVWHFEPGPGRDLAAATISSVKAVQTSTGTDGATDALFKGLELTADFGPMLYSTGALSAIKAAIKKGGTLAGKKLAKLSLKEIAYSIAEKLVGKSAAKTASKSVISTAAKKVWAKITAKVTTALLKKKNLYLGYLRRAKIDLTFKNLKATINNARTVARQVSQAEAKAQMLADLATTLSGSDLVTSATAGSIEAVHRLDAEADALGLARTQELVKQMEAHEAAKNSAEAKGDEALCEVDVPAFQPYFLPLRKGIITAGDLSQESGVTKDLLQVLGEAEAGPAERSLGEAYADLFLMNPGWIKRLLNPLIEDTDDSLEITFNGQSVWPRGGGDHRDISKGETLPVGVTMLFSRQRGIDIGLIEYDYASNDDDMGHLVAATKDLTTARETYADAFIYQKSEGSLYTISFDMVSLNGDHRLEVEAGRSDAACDRIRMREWAMDAKVKAFEQSIADLDMRTNIQKAIIGKFGPMGLDLIGKAQKFQSDLAASCTAGTVDYAALLDGQWRVGGYTDDLQQDRTRTATYIFSKDGNVNTPNYSGGWSPVPKTDRGRWYSASYVKDDDKSDPYAQPGDDSYFEKEVTPAEGCGVYLDLRPQQNSKDGDLPEVFLPIWQVGNAVLAYQYARDYPGTTLASDVIAFTESLNGDRAEANVATPSGAGPKFWLEKMEDAGGSQTESADAIAAAKADFVGSWRVTGLNRHFARAFIDPVNGKPYPEGFKTNEQWSYKGNYVGDTLWFMTSDGKVLIPQGRKVYTTLGTWTYLGDRRFEVKMDAAMHPAQTARGTEVTSSFVAYLGDTPGPELVFHTMASNSARAFVGIRTDAFVNYADMNDRARDDLENLRRTLGVPVPDEEARANPQSLEAMRQARDARREAERLAAIRKLDDARLAANQQLNRDKRKNDPALCNAEYGLSNRWGPDQDQQNLAGVWTFWPQDSRGNVLDMAPGAGWVFAADGTLSGISNGRAWTARWKAVTGCTATVTFDAATAARLKTAPEMTIDLRFAANGDKSVYLVDPYSTVSVFWGSQIVDKTDYTYDYSRIKFTPAQIANRCAPGVFDPALRALNQPIFVDAYALPAQLSWQATPGEKARAAKATLGLYRVNPKGANAEFLGPVPLARLTSFSGFRGDAFVLVGEDNQCVGVVATNTSVTERRSEFPTPVTGPSLVSDADPKRLVSVSYPGRVVVSVDYTEQLSPTQIANQCDVHRFVSSPSYSPSSSKFTQVLANSGPRPIFAYEVARTNGAYSGAYENPIPVLQVAPGSTGLLEDGWGRKFVVLDADEKCVGIVEMGKGDGYGFDFGDGSHPITTRGYLSPSARENGCLTLGRVKSDRYADRRTGLTRPVSNSGPTDLFAYWIGYGGEHDTARPSIVIKPGETRQLIDFNSSFYAILGADRTCVAVKRMDDGANGNGWTFGDGSVAVNTAVAAPTRAPGGIRAGNLNEIQLGNNCAVYGRAASTPRLEGGRLVDFINRSPSPMTLNWVSFYGINEDGEPTRQAGPKVTLEGSTTDTFRTPKSGEHSQFGMTGGDVISVTDAAGNCVGVFTGSDIATDRVYLNDKAQTNAQSKKNADDRAVKNDMDEALADLRSRQKLSQCGPGGIVAAEAISGIWKLGDFDARGKRLPAPAPQLLGISGTNTRPSRIEIDFDPRRYDSLYGADALAHCVVRETGGRIELNLIFNPDGTKEFFTTKPDGTLKQWGVLSPALSAISDADPVADAVDESARIGTPVGITARASDADDQVTYSLRADGPFAIDPLTGIVTVAGALDREAIAHLVVGVIASSADSATQTAFFDIRINDVNEGGVSEITNGAADAGDPVSEAARIGSPVGITAFAVDPDAEARVTYSLSDTAGGLFAIDPVSGIVTIAGTLDWEQAKSHSIEVLASSTDGSSSRKRFEIALTNANEFLVGAVTDNDPRPNQLDQTAPVGSPVGLTAQAFDGDGADTVTYRLVGRESDLFAVDARSGVATLANRAPNPGDYEIEVAAESSDGSSSRARFTIAVAAVNQFALSAITDLDARPDTVVESAPPGTEVGIVASATDADAGTRVTFDLTDSTGGSFAIGVANGLVSVAGPLDFETLPVASIEVRASSSDGSIAVQRFEIAIADANEAGISALVDTDPAFDEVAENAPAGTPVGIVAFAEDPDASDSVAYALDSNPGRAFAIDPAKGAVSVAFDQALDFETAPVLAIDVEATSSDGSQSVARFEIAVRDANEFDIESPVDADPAGNFVAENAAFGTPVGITIASFDRDTSDRVNYALADDASGAVAIDPNTGIVTVAGTVDFEAGRSLSILAEARSTDGSVRQGWFEISVGDIGEFEISPFADIDAGPDEVGEFAPWDAPVGITISASDADGGAGSVNYVLSDEAGNQIIERGPFRIDFDTGRVAIDDAQQLANLAGGAFPLFVLAASQDGSTRVEPISINVIREQRWWENPEGPRVEDDYLDLAPADRDICVAADEDHDNPATFNNETAYFDCLDGFKPKNWYDNPEDPRGLDMSVYDGVLDADWEACVAANTTIGSPTYNNETAFYDCLDSFKPSFVNWYDDPKDPRGLDTSVYNAMPDADWQSCVAINENPSSPNFNNETAFYDCLDAYMPQPSDGTRSGTGGSDDQDTRDAINACAAGHGIQFEPPEDRDAEMSVQNNGGLWLDVYAVSGPGDGSDLAPVTSAAPGQPVDFTAKRLQAFAVFDETGACVGALKAWESRNSVTLP